MSIVFDWLIVTKIKFSCTSTFIYILGIYFDFKCLISRKSSWCDHLLFSIKLEFRRHCPPLMSAFFDEYLFAQ